MPLPAHAGDGHVHATQLLGELRPYRAALPVEVSPVPWAPFQAALEAWRTVASDRAATADACRRCAAALKRASVPRLTRDVADEVAWLDAEWSRGLAAEDATASLRRAKAMASSRTTKVAMIETEDRRRCDPELRAAAESRAVAADARRVRRDAMKQAIVSDYLILLRADARLWRNRGRLQRSGI